MRTISLITACAFLAVSANATVRYVNRDSACPGTGATGSPYCTIQNAFNAAVAGDDIRIRKASVPYDEHATAQSSGTSSAQITVESDDPSNQAVVRWTGNGAVGAPIQIMDKSYWTVQNLILDGTGVFTSTTALWIGCNNCSTMWASGPGMTGHKVLNNTFKHWGGTQAQQTSMSLSNDNALSALTISAGYGPPGGTSPTHLIYGTLVQGNTFDGDRMVEITMTSTANSLVQNNDISHTTCGQQTDGSSGTAIVADGIHIISGTNGVGGSGDVYKNNTIHDFAPTSACTIGGSPSYKEWDALHCDVGPQGSTVDSNTIYNIDQVNGSPPNSTGLHIEDKCFGWTAKNNIIHDIGYEGILNNQYSGSGAVSQYLNNTIYNTLNAGIEVRAGTANIQNNIFDNAASKQIWIRSGAVGHVTVDYNDYWDLSGGSKVGSWNEGGVLNFSSWKSACACDSHSINANPLFVNPPADFHLQSPSPAATTGQGGTFMGALGIGGASAPNPPTELTAAVN